MAALVAVGLIQLVVQEFLVKVMRAAGILDYWVLAAVVVALVRLVATQQQVHQE